MNEQCVRCLSSSFPPVKSGPLWGCGFCFNQRVKQHLFGVGAIVSGKKVAPFKSERLSGLTTVIVRPVKQT